MKSIKIIKANDKNKKDIFQELPDTDMFFTEIHRDTVGNSCANPTWGYAYLCKNGKIRFKGVAIHKEYDYDFPNAAYAEKIWSIMGKKLLGGVRIPDIDVVEEKKGEPEIISYIILNNDKEDMIHIKDVLFNKFTREELYNMNNITSIEDILESIKIQIGDNENYKRIEKGIIETIILDCITNNQDRHSLNWALIRNKDTNEYDLGVYDHSGAFLNMLEYSPVQKNSWTSSYLVLKNEKRKNKTICGKNGNDILDYILEKYPEYYNEFSQKFVENFDEITEAIEKEELEISCKYLEGKLRYKMNYLRDKGEKEYEY